MAENAKVAINQFLCIRIEQDQSSEIPGCYIYSRELY